MSTSCGIRSRQRIGKDASEGVAHFTNNYSAMLFHLHLSSSTVKDMANKLSYFSTGNCVWASSDFLFIQNAYPVHKYGTPLHILTQPRHLTLISIEDHINDSVCNLRSAHLTPSRLAYFVQTYIYLSIFINKRKLFLLQLTFHSQPKSRNWACVSGIIELHWTNSDCIGQFYYRIEGFCQRFALSPGIAKRSSSSWPMSSFQKYKTAPLPWAPSSLQALSHTGLPDSPQLLTIKYGAPQFCPPGGEEPTPYYRTRCTVAERSNRACVTDLVRTGACHWCQGNSPWDVIAMCPLCKIVYSRTSPF